MTRCTCGDRLLTPAERANGICNPCAGAASRRLTAPSMRAVLADVTGWALIGAMIYVALAVLT